MKKIINQLLMLCLMLILCTSTAFAGNDFGLDDGMYDVTLSLEGGSGRATVTEKTTMSVIKECAFVFVEWSSPNYDYMIVDGNTYYPVNTDGNSVFEIPVLALNEGYTVIADTVAMSKPHEIEYTLTVNYKKAGNKKLFTRVIAVIMLVLIVLLQSLKVKKHFIDEKKEAE